MCGSETPGLCTSYSSEGIYNVEDIENGSRRWPMVVTSLPAAGL